MSRGDEQAFPTPPSATHYTPGGMTLREYFAGLAMQGAIACGIRPPKDHAAYAVERADALLAELAKEKP